MESHRIEQAPQVEMKEIASSDEKLLEDAAQLVSKYSWGEDYPVRPIDEIRAAEYRVGAFEREQLVGFGTVGRSFSPDTLDNGELWIAHAVVKSEFRNQGIFTKIYESQLSYAKSHSGRILSCTDNPVVAEFFLKNGWHEVRETTDEAGDKSIVFENNRPDSDTSTSSTESSRDTLTEPGHPGTKPE